MYITRTNINLINASRFFQIDARGGTSVVIRRSVLDPLSCSVRIDDDDDDVYGFGEGKP